MSNNNRKVPIVLSLEEIDLLKEAPNLRYPSRLRDKAIIKFSLKYRFASR